MAQSLPMTEEVVDGYKFERSSNLRLYEMKIQSRWLIFAVARNESFEPMAQSLPMTEEVVGNC